MIIRIVTTLADKTPYARRALPPVDLFDWLMPLVQQPQDQSLQVNKYQ
jgi:hypothetical protein